MHAPTTHGFEVILAALLLISVALDWRTWLNLAIWLAFAMAATGLIVAIHS